ncbi:MAG: LPS export ABC transporter periplasmic protein LptC [Pseudomonadota bacterium]
MATRQHHYLKLSPSGAASREERLSLRPGGGYDRFIAIMRIVLPAIALALALLVVGWPLFNPREMSFLLAIDKVRLSPEQMRMIKPRYFGVDSAGRPFIIEAASALQHSGDDEKVSLSEISAYMTLNEGVEVVSHANEGAYYPERKTLGLVGAVTVTASNGYRLAAADASIDLETRRVTSARPVVGEGPLGHFEAQGFDADIDQDRLAFLGGVKAHIVPRRATLDESPTLDKKTAQDTTRP